MNISAKKQHILPTFSKRLKNPANSPTCCKHIAKFSETFEFELMQKRANLVDLEYLMLQNEYSPANIGFVTTENEPRHVSCMIRAQRCGAASDASSLWASLTFGIYVRSSSLLPWGAGGKVCIGNLQQATSRRSSYGEKFVNI